MNVAPGGEQFLDRVDRLVDGAGGIGLRFEAERRGGRGLLFRQAIDEVVHDDVGQVDVLARAVLEVVAADREGVAVAAEEEHVQVRPRKAHARGQRHRAPVDEMPAVGIDEIREARGAADAREGDDVLVRKLAPLEHLVKRGEHGEIAAAGAPGGMVGGEVFLGQLFGVRAMWRGWYRWRSFQNSFEDFFHAECQAVGLCEAADFRVAIARPQDGRQLAVAVKALVVHFGDDDALEAREDFFEAVRQRVQVAQVQRGDALAAVRARSSPPRGSGRRSSPSRRSAPRPPGRHRLPAPGFPPPVAAACCGAWPSSPVCSCGLPVGWPISSCSRPVTIGYFPSEHPRARAERAA